MLVSEGPEPGEPAGNLGTITVSSVMQRSVPGCVSLHYSVPLPQPNGTASLEV